MRPLALTIEGLRSFRSQVQISFEGRDNIAIIGDTGAGKSSIIEAMTYALFGRATFSGQANQEIINDLAEHMRVTLRFAVGGETYEVTRTLRRAADGSVGAAKAAMTEFGADGSEVRKIEHVRPVNARVQSVLGLDADAFLRTVVLPQGQFAQLLVDDDPAERAAILRQVWRTDELTEAGRLAEETLPEISQLVGQVTQALAGMPSNPVDHLEQLRAAAARLGEAAKRAGETHQAAIKARDTLKEAGRTIARAESLARELDELDFDTVTTAAETIAREAAAIDAERRAAEEEQRALRKQLEAVPPDDDGLDGHAIAAGRAILNDLPRRAEAAESAAAGARQSAQEATEAEVRLRESEDLLQEVEGQLQGRSEKQEQLEAKRATAEAKQREAENLLRRGLQAAADARALEAQAGEKDDAAERLTTQEAALGEGALAEAQQQAARCEKEYDEAQRHNAAAAAADGLHPGSECTVCGRPLPQDWQPPAAEDLEAARAAYESARARLSELQQQAHSLASRAQDAALEGAELRVRANEQWQRAGSIADRLAELVGRESIDLATLSPVPEERSIVDVHGELLQPLSSAVSQAIGELRAHEAESQELRERRAALLANTRHARDAMESAQARATERLSAAEAATKALREALESLPDQLRIDVLLPDHAVEIATVRLEGLDAAQQTLDARAQELQRRSELRSRLSAELDSVRERLDDVEYRRRSTVLQPGNQVVTTVNAHRDVVSRAIENLNIQDVELQPAVSLGEPAELPSIVQRLRETTRVIRERADELIRTTRQAVEAARQELAKLAAELELSTGDHDDVDSEQVVSHAGVLASDAQVEARAAHREAEEFALLVEPLQQLQQAGDELITAHSVLHDLSVALKPGAFPKWLTLRRSRALLVHAALLLQQMSGGRYSFAELTDESAEWRIVDNDSGLARSPASLSGGEKFIASLALALGMVEMMARAGGRLESLWLDEGFGALDRSNLDAAIEALGSVAAKGRMVAVISHIRAVAEQVTHVLAVTREPTGTQVRWLDPAQRTKMASRDLETDTGALPGLID